MTLTDDDMDAYVKIRRRSGVKYATITRELTDVKAILNFAAKRKPPLIPFNPVRDYKKPKPKPKRKRKRPPARIPIDQRPIIHYHGHAVEKIGKAWKGALTRAGIARRLRPYDLRHYFVTTALEQGADIKALAEVVGSRPETLIRHYQHVTKEIHRQTVAKISALDPET